MFTLTVTSITPGSQICALKELILLDTENQESATF
jgi:hypothetical protein